MPNIEIYGVAPNRSLEDLQAAIEKVVRDLGLEAQFITTFVPAMTKRGGSDVPASYLRVCDTDRVRGRRIAVALAKDLEVEVELLVLDGFFDPENPSEG